jgi:hypothetical protein
MCKITVFKTIESDSQSQYFEIDEVFDRIRRGNNRHLIEQIRAEKNKIQRDFLKKKLFWICFSGQFTKRNNESLVEHSGFICLDFDGITEKEIPFWRNKLQTNPFTYSCFISPSGNGLKAIWKVPVCTTNDEHNRRFEAIAETFSDCRYFDKNVKGWSRVCFESYDPQIYVNTTAATFEGIIEPVPIRTPIREVKSDNVDVQITFDKLIKWFESKHNMRKGNRNQGAFTFASGVAEYLREDQAEPMLTAYIMQNVEQDHSDPFTANECQTCIKQAYRNTPQPRKQMGTPDEPNVSKELVIDTDDLKEPERTVFWTTGRTIKVDYLAFKLFLQENGFFKYRFNPDDISFIRIQSNIVSIVTIDDIRDFVLSFLLTAGENAAYNLFAADSKFEKKYIAFLDIKKPKFIKDTKTESWTFYKNKAVRVSANGIDIIDYIDIDGYIWERQKIDRNISKVDYNGDFAKFLMNVSNNDIKRCQSLLSGIGYMMHRYKDPSRVRAMIANEEAKDSSPAGGTGKGLLFQALSKVRVVTFIEGKSIDVTKDFVWDLVTPYTDIVAIDDPPKGFKFENLFSILTTGWPIKQKYKSTVYLDADDSPKIGIASNNVMKGNSSSHERRKFEVEFYPYYNDKHQPIDDFGQSFFREWNDIEWCRFDNLMLMAQLLYMQKGLIVVDFVNLKIRKMMAETSDEFVEFAREHFADNNRYHRNEYYEKFRIENPGSYVKSSNQFYEWMRTWANYCGWEWKDCGAGRSYIEFGVVGENIFAPMPNEVNDRLPF